MAKKFLVPIDLSFLELMNARLHMLDEHPDTGTPEGLFYYNIDTNKIVFHNGTQWVSLEDSGSVSGVTSISASSPIQRDVSTGDVTLSILAASTENAGSMSSSHFDLLAGATNNNTASTLVQRDGSGNFSAGTITASLNGSASQLNNQNASHYLDRANHSGSQAASTISDLATVVQGYRLDQFAAPTDSVSFGSQRITSLATPEGDNDAATKAYVDAISAGLDYKESVRAASEEEENLTLSNEQTVDGVELVDGDRVLVWQQTDPAENGIYIVVDDGPWVRAADAVTGPLNSGAFVFVEEGTENSGYKFVLSTPNPIVVGTTELEWRVYGAGETIVAGDGLDKTGSELSVVGTANRISVSGSGVDISATYVGQTSITTLGTIGTGTWQGSTVGVAYGGTGISSYTTNNYIRASGATTLEQRTPEQVLSDIGAAASGHTHALGDLSDVDVAGADDGYLLVYDDGDWVASAAPPVVSIGTVGQIPVSNSGGSDFDYSAALTFASNVLGVATNTSDTTPTLTVTNAGVGDAALRLGVTGRSYAVGIDNSNEDYFVISTGTAIDSAVPGTGDLVRIHSSGTVFFNGTVSSAQNTGDANFTTGSTGIGGYSATSRELAGSSGSSSRVSFHGSAAGTLTQNYSYASLLVSPTGIVTENATGTHPLVSQLAIKPLTLNNAAGSTTNGATLYIEGPTIGTATITNNYAMWIDAGDVRIDALAAETSETNILTVDDVGVFSSSSIESLIPSDITRKYAVDLYDEEEAETVFIVTHNLGTEDVVPTVYDASKEAVIVNFRVIDANNLEVSFGYPPDEVYRAVVVG